jgi:AraC-like DNA-binding protein
MKLENYRMMKDPDRSFILHHETQGFSNWHHHPEYELVCIINGKGRRLVGDNIDTFGPGDLVLLGPFLPHSWICDNEFAGDAKGFGGEAIVIQFLDNFLGKEFMEIPENSRLRQILGESSRGLLFTGKTREELRALLAGSYELDGSDQLFVLMTLFRILSKTPKYQPLSSAGFIEPYHRAGNEPVQKAIDYILHNFNRDISVGELLDITNMSNTTFCIAFRRITRMTFKEYLIHTRIGYACKLLTNTGQTISQIAFSCGFENLSNFNQKFRRIKNVTPSVYRSSAKRHGAEGSAVAVNFRDL